MTIINQKSISGITSITFASAGDDLLTFHSNNGTERFRIDNSGNTKITAGIVTTLTTTGNATVGGTLSVTGTSTLSSNKSQFDSTGTLYLNSAGSVGSGNYYTKIASDGSADFLSNVSIADKIIHYGDTNTAIRFPAADTVTVETAGNERFRVTSDGKVGINTDMGGAPASLYPFSVYRSTGTGYVYTETAQSGASAGFRAKAGTSDFTIFTTQGTGQLAVYDNTNSAERLRITSGGLVGIGTDTPGAILEVFDATSNTILNVKSGDSGASLNLIDDSARSTIEQNGTTLKISSDTGAEDASSDIRLQVDGASKMIIRDSGDVVTGVPGHDNQNNTGSRTVFTVADTTNGALLHVRGQSPAAFFDITGAGSIGKVFLDNVDFAIQSGTPASEGTERVRIRSSGGITFNGDTAAANALDDYEEGTWTPTSGTNMGTLTGAAGGYTKIGRLVYVNFGFTTSSVSTSANSKIGGLPFNPNDVIPNTSVESTGLCFVDDRFYSMQVQGGTSNVIIETDRPLQGSTSSGSQFLRGSVVYMTDE